MFIHVDILYYNHWIHMGDGFYSKPARKNERITSILKPHLKCLNVVPISAARDKEEGLLPRQRPWRGNLGAMNLNF